jgi:tripartite-type tricarboxylate transporter receptor subunit TctC
LRQIPKPIVKTHSDALDAIKKDEAFTARMEPSGMAALDSSPDQARDDIRTERAIWKHVVKSIGIKLPN